MPFRPEFDLYEALELTSTASATEITSSYRRLAREHHPDKNPDNVEATEKMQRINAAHEILSDTNLRAQYDSCPSTPESGSSSYYSYPYAGNAYRYDFEDEFMQQFFSQSDGYHYDHTHSQNPDMDRMAAEDAIRMQHRAEQQAKYAREQAEKWSKEQDEKAARAKQKKQDEALSQALKEARARDEKERQQQFWNSIGAVTAAEKRASCLHSNFWPRHQGKSKYKCMGCFQKRGPTGFKCPHCELLQCQSCLNAFQAQQPGN
ncbi:DnaJ domain-containing protein [Rhexocercosporidium sp. MPI-PUGE-AT-0058]|nr:DnaJ domain-containing protein [Rhexocercosporidium sp. MPI-PUGE-AT-0058]